MEPCGFRFSEAHGCHAGVRKHDYRMDDDSDSHRPADNRQRSNNRATGYSRICSRQGQASHQGVAGYLAHFATMSMKHKRTPACAAAVVSSVLAGSRAVRILRADMQPISDTRQPCPALTLPCDAADGHTNNVSEGFPPLLACAHRRRHIKSGHW